MPARDIPYARQSIGQDDIERVAEALRSPFLTGGPLVGAFEKAVAERCGAGHAVAVANGTAALHLAMRAIGVSEGDEVIVPPITFAATANSVVFCGGKPVFADVDPGTLLICPDKVAERISPRTKAVIAVDYAGQPCDYPALREAIGQRDVVLVADACHSLGAALGGKPVGQLADLSIFSFHPVKHIATGEGGMVATDNVQWAEACRKLRNHGIDQDFNRRGAAGQWRYDITALGYNYRITDIQCALGLSQFGKLDDFLRRRREIADQYDAAFRGTPIRPLARAESADHAFHLYVVRVAERDQCYMALLEAGIRANVHYWPTHLLTFYRETFGYGEGLCPAAEEAAREILSLPMFPDLSGEEQQRVVAALGDFAHGA